MTTVQQVLNHKRTTDIYMIQPQQTVFEAISYLAQKGVGALPVVEHGKLVGMFSKRDYTRKIALFDRNSKNTLVADIMSTTLTTVSKNTTVDECLALMTVKHIRHLPVLENNQLVGFLSIGDLVKTVIESQQKLINHLQDYISGQ